MVCAPGLLNKTNTCPHTQVLDHYENPRNVGSLDKNDVSVGTGLVGAPACGDVMKLQVRNPSREGRKSCLFLSLSVAFLCKGKYSYTQQY